MTTNPSQGKRPDPADTYGGYGGYSPEKSADDPYGAYGQQQGAQQQSDPDYAYGQSQQQQASSSQGQQQQASSSQGQQQQQEFTYQPPESVLRKRSRHSFGIPASAATGGSSAVSKEDRRFALFSYLGFCFTGIVFFFWKGKRPFVRFHAAQSVFLFAPVFAALMVIKVLGILTLIPLLGALFAFVFSVLNFLIGVPAVLLWLYLMFNAYRGVTVKLPIIGDYAERFTNRGNGNKAA
jgi:uncharacterized membrane protein